MMEMEKEYQGYLPCTPYESWIEHMKQLSCQDMEQQCDYIRLSMGLLNHGYIGEKKIRDGQMKIFVYIKLQSGFAEQL